MANTQVYLINRVAALVSVKIVDETGQKPAKEDKVCPVNDVKIE